MTDIDWRFNLTYQDCQRLLDIDSGSKLKNRLQLFVERIICWIDCKPMSDCTFLNLKC